eukprot:scaffold110323_cov72-Phaeocystis_antarctica.AAC.3
MRGWDERLGSGSGSGSEVRVWIGSGSGLGLEGRCRGSTARARRLWYGCSRCAPSGHRPAGCVRQRTRSR